MSLEESLSAVEQLIDKVTAALLAADPQSLEQHSVAGSVAIRMEG
jgi:hypothetical protein